MIKNKLDFKLINLAILVLIIYLILQTKEIWMEVVLIIKKVLLPFFLSFIIAYIFYPLLYFLRKHSIPKILSIILIITIIITIIILGCIYIIPNLIHQLTDITSNLIIFVKAFLFRFNLNYNNFTDIIFEKLNNRLFILIKFLTINIYNITTTSFSVITYLLIIVSSSIYLLSDMDKIRYRFKLFLKNHNLKTFNYVKMIDSEMKKYLIGFTLIMIITFFEYLLGYIIIRHPNYLILALLASIGNIIPCFGGFVSNIISLIISLVISPKLFIRNIILIVILSNIDNYVINPLVYGSTNSVPPVLIILSIFAGGILFGIIGIIFSMPLVIILVSSYRFFRHYNNLNVDSSKF